MSEQNCDWLGGSKRPHCLHFFSGIQISPLCHSLSRRYGGSTFVSVSFSHNTQYSRLLRSNIENVTPAKRLSSHRLSRAFFDCSRLGSSVHDNCANVCSRRSHIRLRFSCRIFCIERWAFRSSGKKIGFQHKGSCSIGANFARIVFSFQSEFSSHHHNIPVLE